MEFLWSPWRMQYVQGDIDPVECIFCYAITKPDNMENLIVHRGKFAFVVMNRFPYTTGHMMVVPFDHIASLEQLEAATRGELMELTGHCIEVLKKLYKPDGFNVGANIGSAAGAGVAGHVHIHVVARWVGDTNFMSTLAQTRVLPEDLEVTYENLRSNW